eukprot:TRINITY_DN3720_c1_g1_i1.p1 TRINITY_DN3720_c1_g1~~TRINITY_DN3720_c1_g1_i1.p1  ORF type:complete len:254 (+),score=-19.76 TRINITY_DN3720_c1_g1_i1:193-954(+)
MTCQRKSLTTTKVSKLYSQKQGNTFYASHSMNKNIQNSQQIQKIANQSLIQYQTKIFNQISQKNPVMNVQNQIYVSNQIQPNTFRDLSFLHQKLANSNFVQLQNKQIVRFNSELMFQHFLPNQINHILQQQYGFKLYDINNLRYIIKKYNTIKIFNRRIYKCTQQLLQILQKNSKIIKHTANQTNLHQTNAKISQTYLKRSFSLIFVNQQSQNYFSVSNMQILMKIYKFQVFNLRIQWKLYYNQVSEKVKFKL